MKKHIRIYCDYFRIGEQDVISCENCGRTGRVDHGGFDIHHIIPKSQGGKDEIENLICLDRKCHTAAHNEEFTKSTLFYMHKIRMNAHERSLR